MDNGVCGGDRIEPDDDYWRAAGGVIRVGGAAYDRCDRRAEPRGQFAADLFDLEQCEDRRRGYEVTLPDAQHADGESATLG